jgi:DNA-binding SARP family transcriptional activator/TolB-like protein
MPTLAMLGRIGLDDGDGAELDSLLRQPKRLALLAYLASPRPGTWHRRDTLLSVFWPELDSGRARTALRSALYTLRQHLGEGVLRSRGDDELSLDPDRLTTDASRLEADLTAGRHADALARYGGDLLPGLFIPEAEGFEKWLDEERRRLKALARKAAAALMRDCERAGDARGASAAAARAVELDPEDETALRHWIELLDQAGDRGLALTAYERFRSRLFAEFGAEPSQETVRLARAIAARRAPEAPPRPPPGKGIATAAAETPRAPPSTESPSDQRVPSVRLRSRRQLALVVGLALLAAATIAVARWPARSRATGPPPRSLIVLPMENATGDTQAAYLATGLADDIARRLRGIGGLQTVRSSVRANWPPAVRNDLALIGREFGLEAALQTRLIRAHDSLTVSSELLDLKTGQVRDVGRQAFTVGNLPDAGSRIAAAVAGALFRTPIPEMPRAPATPIDPESYRLTLAGWHELLGGSDLGRARKLFSEATAKDPTNARAWAGMSSALSAIAVINWAAPIDQEYARAEAAATHALALDSLQGTAWANLGILRATSQRSVAAGETLIQRGIQVEPSNPELYMILSAMYTNAWEWDKARDAIRIARQLDPLTSFYAEREAFIELCANRPEEALRLYRIDLRLDPTDRGARHGAARALARLERFDEALTTLRESGDGDDTAVVRMLGAAKGERGYRQVVELQGKRRLAAALAVRTPGSGSPVELGLAYLAAGDADRGLTLLERALRDGQSRLGRLPCWEVSDQWRDLPRFRALLARVESTKLH